MAQDSYPFGGAPPGFIVQEILLYCLQVNVTTGVCTYTSSSGSYTNYASISSFIGALQAGTLSAPSAPLPPFGPGEAPPDIIVTEPGYVVMELSSPDEPTLCFQSTAMTTGTDCSTKYYGLTETSVSSGGTPTVAYFAVPVVAPASENVNDPYTLFLQYMSDGSTIPYDIDPCIRNRGSG
jgi:hypothetical protein